MYTQEKTNFVIVSMKPVKLGTLNIVLIDTEEY